MLAVDPVKIFRPSIAIWSIRIPPGGRGEGGGTTFGPYLTHSRNVSAEKVRSIPHLYAYAHLLHWLQRAFVARGNGDPDGGSPRFFFYVCYQPTRLKGIGLQGCRVILSRWSRARSDLGMGAGQRNGGSSRQGGFEGEGARAPVVERGRIGRGSTGKNESGQIPALPSGEVRSRG
jgi:hypothetical protein